MPCVPLYYANNDATNKLKALRCLGQVVGQTHQQLEAPSPRTYIGSGKVEEVVGAIAETGAETLIFDDELTPGQLRNLERSLGDRVRICDRTALILDIFSQRAATREGQLQVELAQCEYQLPRLTRMWTHLERQVCASLPSRLPCRSLLLIWRLLKDSACAIVIVIHQSSCSHSAVKWPHALHHTPIGAVHARLLTGLIRRFRCMGTGLL